MQTSIPFIFMRAGTSRGAYFNKKDLPEDRDTLAQVLISVMGSGDALNINGLGGTNAVTTKVAILSKSDDEWADIDYFFAQVSPDKHEVDFKPTCGNILSAVAAASVEMGLFTTDKNTADIKIKAVNTGARIISTITLKGGTPLYHGDTVLAGIAQNGAPVTLKFMDATGAVTGALLPTGNSQDIIDDIAVTCMDVAMPMVIAKAEDFGLDGMESVQDLDANTDFFAKMENIRIEAGRRMGMGDVGSSVVPKFAVLSPARAGGTICVRYFMPWKTHPSVAVTGAQCIASCLLAPQTVTDDMVDCTALLSPATIELEHPAGSLEVVVDYQDGDDFEIVSAGLIRTVRKLASGMVFVPTYVWDGGYTP